MSGLPSATPGPLTWLWFARAGRSLALVASSVLAITALAGCGHDPAEAPPTVSAVWTRDAELPESVTEGAQPAIGDDGVRHRVAACRSEGEHLRYEVEVRNPYAEPLTAFFFTSIGEGSSGGIWGLWRAELPRGRSVVEFDTRGLDDDLFEEVRAETLAAVPQRRIECSVHLVGFREGRTHRVEFPVAYGRFD